MATELLEIYPRELKFIFELKKPSYCSVRLVNKSNHYVAFKVKTTSPKRYCVRPNTGIVKPKSSWEFTVTMQAHRLAPDMDCKDKFLIQSTVVPVGTTDEGITPSMFAKDDSRKILENKLKVILIRAPSSPELSPISGTLKQGPANEASILKDQLLSRVEIISPHYIAANDIKDSKFVNDDEKSKIVDDYEKSKPVKDEELKTKQDDEDLKLVEELEEMKLKLNELASKLSEADVTILKLKKERRLTMEEIDILQQEIASLRNNQSVRRLRKGFPFLYVCIVAVISVMLGYVIHR